MEIKRSNPNALRQLEIRIKDLGSKQGKVGWFENDKYPESGTPVAYVAAIQELGSPIGKIPPRPFMRPAVTDNKNKWEQLAALGARAILAGKSTPEKAMTALTQSAYNAVSKNIATLTAPPLSPITLGARKYRQQGKKVTGKTIGEIAALLKEGKLDISGVSTKPLEDTGQLSATLRAEVEDANS